MTAIRSPAVAGQFYAGTATGLRDQIETAFTHEIGPGAIPAAGEGSSDVMGLVSPHAGYPYSGPVAAHGFGALAESGRPDAIVLVGPNHRGMGERVAVSDADAWETPLGTVDVHAEMRRALLDRSELVVADERTHAGEHSLEVQVPFIQYLYESPPPILPLVMTRQDEDTVLSLAENLQTVLESASESVAVLASTDMTHYEPADVAKRQDRKAIERMEALDGPGLLDTVARENITMCGYGPTAVALSVAEGRTGTGGELLQYATSGDTGGPSREVVGYASVLIR
jgi:hypothetical protein